AVISRKFRLTGTRKLAASVIARVPMVSHSNQFLPAPRNSRAKKTTETSAHASATCAHRRMSANSAGVCACISATSNPTTAAAASAQLLNKRSVRASRDRSHTSRCTPATVRHADAIIEQMTVTQVMMVSAEVAVETEEDEENAAPRLSLSTAHR